MTRSPKPGEKPLYRPSNGTEGEIFDAGWCSQCKRDAAYRADPDHAEGCEILARALAYDIEDERYPREWVRIETLAPDGLPINDGECTAFEPIP